MNHNLKVGMTLDALDKEFEILGVTQQQSIMGGSNSSNGPSPAEMLVNSMFAGGSSGTFSYSGGTSSATAKASILKLAETSVGMALLTQIQASGQHINLNGSAMPPGSTAPAGYDPTTNTINVSNFSSSNGQLAAHELFHAYAQNARGSSSNETSNTTSNETQAYLFQLKYKEESHTFDVNNPIAAAAISNNITPSDGLDKAEQDYGNSMVSLVRDGYNMANFNTATKNFKTGSAANSDCIYDNLSASSELGGESQVPLIAQFLPAPPVS